MITKERADELMARFKAELSFDPASQEWRAFLSEEEQELVEGWDGVLIRILLDTLKQQMPEP